MSAPSRYSRGAASRGAAAPSPLDHGATRHPVSLPGKWVLERRRVTGTAGNTQAGPCVLGGGKLTSEPSTKHQVHSTEQAQAGTAAMVKGVVAMTMVGRRLDRA
jgi:hypothetical protein